MLTHMQAAAKSGLSFTDILKGSKAAPSARRLAKPGQSNFFVGAAFMLSQGQVVSGANWETVSDVGMCAEGNALSNFFQMGIEAKEIAAIFVAGAPKDSIAAIECTPCGGCRDRLATFLAPETPIITVSLDAEIFGVYPLENLHPTFYLDKKVLISKDIDLSKFEIVNPPRNHDLKHVYAPYHKGNVEMITCITLNAMNEYGDHFFHGQTLQNAAYPLTTNAAGAAMAFWHGHGQPRVIAIVYTLGEETKPSAATFQRLREFCALDTPILFRDHQDRPFWRCTLGQALPRSFGPDNLSSANKIDVGPKP